MSTPKALIISLGLSVAFVTGVLLYPKADDTVESTPTEEVELAKIHIMTWNSPVVVVNAGEQK